MSDKGTENITEIIEITYDRMMQLRFSYMFLQSIITNGNIASDYPNLCFALQSSFATDVYTTVNSLFSNGTYSFDRIAKINPELEADVDECKAKIEKDIPNFREIRNKMFCHAIKRKTYPAIGNVIRNFMSVFYDVMNLHQKCRLKFNIKDDEFKHYENKDFGIIQKELFNFSQLLLVGFLTKGAQDFLDSRKESIDEDN